MNPTIARLHDELDRLGIPWEHECEEDADELGVLLHVERTYFMGYTAMHCWGNDDDGRKFFIPPTLRFADYLELERPDGSRDVLTVDEIVEVIS